MHRLPSYLRSLVTAMVAFLVAILLPATVQAAPQIRTIESGGIDATGTPVTDGFVVVFDTPVDVGTLIKMFGPRYKASTGQDLTIEQIQARNPTNTFPRCNTPEGSARPVRLGDIGAWMDPPTCAVKDRMLGLGLGYAARLVIPLNHVETVEERIARAEADERCLKDVGCLIERLTLLGAQPPVVAPADDPVVKLLVEHEETIASLEATNAALTRENDALKASPTQVASTPNRNPTPSYPFFPLGMAVLGLVATGFVAGKTYQKRRQAKQAAALMLVPAAPLVPSDPPASTPFRHIAEGFEHTEVIHHLPSGRPGRTTGSKVSSHILKSSKTADMRLALTAVTDTQEYKELSARHETLTKDYNALVREKADLLKKVEDLQQENAVLRAQPPPQVTLPQVNITGSNVVIQTSAPVSPSAPTVAAPMPTVEPVVTPAPRSTFVPVAPVFGPPPASPPVVTTVSHNEAELEAQIEKDREELATMGSSQPDRLITLGRKIQDDVATLKLLRSAREPVPDPIPALEVPLTVERTSVTAEEHDHSGTRITIPDHRLSPHAPPSLSQQEREIAELKHELQNHQRAFVAFKRRLRNFVIAPLTKRADDAETRLAYTVEKNHEQKVRRKRAAKIYAEKRIQEYARDVVSRHIGRAPDVPIVTEDLVLAYALEHEIKRANDAEDLLCKERKVLWEVRKRRDDLEAWKARVTTQVIPHFQRYRAFLWGRIEQLTSDLEGANALAESIDVNRYAQLEVEEARLTGALLGKDYRLRELEHDARFSTKKLHDVMEKRENFVYIWKQVQEIGADLIVAEKEGSDTSTHQQLLDSHFAHVTPLFKELTGVEIFDLMVTPHGTGNEPPASHRSILQRVSIAPKVPMFADLEETYVPNGDDPPPSNRNGKTRSYTPAYGTAVLNPRDSAPEIEIHNNGRTLVSDDITFAYALINAFDPSPEKAQPRFVVTSKFVDWLADLHKYPSVLDKKLVRNQPPETQRSLTRDPETIWENVQRVRALGLRESKQTLLPPFEGLPHPLADKPKNGA